MKSSCLGGFVAAIVLIFSVSAQAGEGAIDSHKLSAMGLSNATVVTDQVSQSVRGHGFAVAGGISLAHVGTQAGSLNFYLGVGNHFAAGTNYSEAGKTVTNTKVVKAFGVPVGSVKRTRSISVYAGGFSGAVAF